MVAQRNPDQTRRKIIDAALEEIHLRGFQGMRVDHILSRTGLTKGALYHHFSNKMSIGYAIVDEVLEPEILEKWVKPLTNTNDPIGCIIDICMRERKDRTPDEIEKGCPINNLTQEMSPIDEGFRGRLEGVYYLWTAAIAGALSRGQTNGIIRTDINPNHVAQFLLASLQGIVGVAKCCKSEQALTDMGDCLKDYLEQLKVRAVITTA